MLRDANQTHQPSPMNPPQHRDVYVHGVTLGRSTDTGRLSAAAAGAFLVVDATEGVTARGLSLPLPTLAEALVPMLVLPMLVCEDVSEKPSPALSSPDPNSAFHLCNMENPVGRRDSRRSRRGEGGGSVTSFSVYRIYAESGRDTTLGWNLSEQLQDVGMVELPKPIENETPWAVAIQYSTAVHRAKPTESRIISISEQATQDGGRSGACPDPDSPCAPLLASRGLNDLHHAHYTQHVTGALVHHREVKVLVLVHLNDVT